MDVCVITLHERLMYADCSERARLTFLGVMTVGWRCGCAGELVEWGRDRGVLCCRWKVLRFFYESILELKALNLSDETLAHNQKELGKLLLFVAWNIYNWSWWSRVLWNEKLKENVNSWNKKENEEISCDHRLLYLLGADYLISKKKFICKKGFLVILNIHSFMTSFQFHLSGRKY